MGARGVEYHRSPEGMCLEYQGWAESLEGCFGGMLVLSLRGPLLFEPEEGHVHHGP